MLVWVKIDPKRGEKKKLYWLKSLHPNAVVDAAVFGAFRKRSTAAQMEEKGPSAMILSLKASWRSRRKMLLAGTGPFFLCGAADEGVTPRRSVHLPHQGAGSVAAGSCCWRELLLNYFLVVSHKAERVDQLTVWYPG